MHFKQHLGHASFRWQGNSESFSGKGIMYRNVPNLNSWQIIFKFQIIKIGQIQQEKERIIYLTRDAFPQVLLAGVQLRLFSHVNGFK